MCYYRENKPPCYCTYREFMYACSSATYTAPAGNLQPCGRMMAIPSAGLRSCAKCESEVNLIGDHPVYPWEIDLDALLFDHTNPDVWREIDEIISTHQLNWQFPSAFAGNRISFVPRISPPSAAGSSRPPPTTGTQATTPFPIVDDFASNSPSSQPIGTTPLQPEEQLPHPTAPPGHGIVPAQNPPGIPTHNPSGVPTQKPSGVKRPAGPPVSNAQPPKRQKQQPQNEIWRVEPLPPPNAPPPETDNYRPQIPGTKRSAPMPPENTQPQKRQKKNQHQNAVLTEGTSRRNTLPSENRAKASSTLQVAAQQEGQTQTTAVPLPATPANNIPPTSINRSVAATTHPPNTHIPPPGQEEPSASQAAAEEQQRRFRHKAAKKEEQQRRKALLAKNRADAYPQQQEPSQQAAAVPTTAGPSQLEPPSSNIPTNTFFGPGAPTTMRQPNHPPPASAAAHNNPYVSHTRTQHPIITAPMTTTQTTVPTPQSVPQPLPAQAQTLPTTYRNLSVPANPQIPQNPIALSLSQAQARIQHYRHQTAQSRQPIPNPTPGLNANTNTNTNIDLASYTHPHPNTATTTTAAAIATLPLTTQSPTHLVSILPDGNIISLGHETYNPPPRHGDV